jgi:hypothetical protein
MNFSLFEWLAGMIRYDGCRVASVGLSCVLDVALSLVDHDRISLGKAWNGREGSCLLIPMK